MCRQFAAVNKNWGLEVTMATNHHIWLPWQQTSMHLRSYADLPDFSHGLEKSSNNGVMSFLKANQYEASSGATCTITLCQGLYCMSRDRVLWTKRGSDLSRATMQLFWDSNNTHIQLIHMLLHGPHPQHQHHVKWIHGKGTKGNFILNSFLLTKGQFVFVQIQ